MLSHVWCLYVTNKILTPRKYGQLCPTNLKLLHITHKPWDSCWIYLIKKVSSCGAIPANVINWLFVGLLLT
jgi:hypothetical protein